jgi:hypothetical protein
MSDYTKLPTDVLEQKRESVERRLQGAAAHPFPFTGPGARTVVGLIDGRKRIMAELTRRGVLK